jgi:hypothetical protein
MSERLNATDLQARAEEAVKERVKGQTWPEGAKPYDVRILGGPDNEGKYFVSYKMDCLDYSTGKLFPITKWIGLG